MPSAPVYSSQPSQDESLGHGEKNVTTAGTTVALVASPVACCEVLIQAKRTNTGRIYVGGASIPNDDSAGVYLTAGQSLPISLTNLDKIYINSTVNGEGVTYIYSKA